MFALIPDYESPKASQIHMSRKSQDKLWEDYLEQQQSRPNTSTLGVPNTTVVASNYTLKKVDTTSTMSQSPSELNRLFGLNCTQQPLSSSQEEKKRSIILEQERELRILNRDEVKKVKTQHQFTLTQYVRTSNVKHPSAATSHVTGCINMSDDSYESRQSVESEPSNNFKAVTPENKKKSTATVTEPILKQSSGTVFPDAQENKRYCSHCKDYSDSCHSIVFGDYCTGAVDFEFRQSPLGMSRKKIAEIFIVTYNHALDYVKFREENNLHPKAFYYPPVCIKEELDDIIDKIEGEQYNHIEKNIAYTTQGDIGLRSEVCHPCMTINSSDTPNDLTCNAVCEGCNMNTEECHSYLFGDYCTAHVKRDMEYYPGRITGYAAKKIFIKWYNSALHFCTYEEGRGNYPNRCFINPPPCLEDDMMKIVNIASQNYDDAKQKFPDWTETDTNLYGIDDDA